MRPGVFLILLMLPVWLFSEQQQGVLLELRIAQIERDQLQLRNLHLKFSGVGEGVAMRLRVDEVRLPGESVPLRDIEIVCPVAFVDWPAIACDEAVVNVSQSPWGGQELQIALDWRSEAAWQLSFKGLRYAGDSLSGYLSMQGDSWKASVSAKALRLAALEPLLELRAQAGLSSLSGLLGAEVQAQGDLQGLASISAQGNVRKLAWSDEAGLQAAENLRARYYLEATRAGDDWRGAARLRLLSGELYSDPVFLDLKAQPLRLALKGRWRANAEQMLLSSLSLDAGQMLEVRGSLSLGTADGKLGDARLSLKMTDLAQAYGGLLQPLLIGTSLDDVEIGGALQADLELRSGQLSKLDAQLERVDMDDVEGRFGVLGLSADLHWLPDRDAKPSQLGFGSAHLGDLDFGAAAIRLAARGPYVHLLVPVRIPFYRGSVAIDDLTWVTTGNGHEAGFSIGLRNVSLEDLSLAMGWPEMAGTIDAELPGARLTQDRFEVDGDIQIEAFDGRMLLRNVRLDQLGSAAPVLEAGLELRGLDLAKVTETFSFGRIRGRLDGEVSNLQLVAWEPNRFEARFYSPQNDDLPHRISQDAVQDLTELGNGVSGALSGPFLQFFKEFSYDRVELQVSQRGDRAQIGGIPHSSGGYYLVKGSGLPRIDVIGRNRDVAWKDLVERLRSIRFDEIEVE